MRITILAVGKWKAGPDKDLFEEYCRRLKWTVAVKEVEEHRKVPAAQLMAREGELLMAGLPKPSGDVFTVALDQRGKALSSEEFANHVRQLRDRGVQDLSFVIGGADGLSKSLLERANQILSLGPMTWPHLLVRVMLIEQLYRAQQILAGHPYHRG